jgi:microcystin synthetase protein McyG
MADLSRRLESLTPEKRALLERRLGRSATPSHAMGAEPIAIIGMGCRFPGGADSPAAFWRLLVERRDAIRRVPTDRWNVDEVVDPSVTSGSEVGTRWGGFLDRVDEFDPGFFGIAPREAAQMDPQQRLLLEVGWEALEEAGQTWEGLAGSATGVFVGIHSQSADYYWLQLGDRSAIDTYTASGGAHSIMANRLSYLLDLRGPSIAIDTACSSSLVALHLACQSLWTGDCDMALAGGVNLILSPETGLTYAKMQMLAPDGRCKTFDASADGFVRAEGCGLVVLRRLADALRDCDPILALIRGTAVNQDGATNGLTAPNGLAQQAVVRRALAAAGVEPEAVGYVETHGTGTSLGDPIEVEALAATVGRPRAGGRLCILGAAKANIGHLEAAAGVAGLIKAVLCLQNEAIPGQPHFGTLNPHISLTGTAFAIPSAMTPWPRGATPRIAGVSSFGFGGTNAHVVLEEAQASVGRAGASAAGIQDVAEGPVVLPISARSEGALKGLAMAYRERLDSGEYDAPELFRDMCYSAAVRRSHHDFRLAVTGRDARDCAAGLGAFLAAEGSPQVAHGRVEGERERGPVFVFTGQGPQWAGMGRELLESEPVFQKVIGDCEKLVRATAGWSLVQELQAPEATSRLAETEVAQPALFALQIGLAAVWRAWGIEPSAVIGHSLGEVAAAHIAGALSLDEAVRVVVHRGRVMQRATGRGKMAAVNLSREEAEAAIANCRDRVTVGAVNAPRSTVLSGDSSILDEVLAVLTKRGVRCQPLPVNYAFHSHQMDPLTAELVYALGALSVQPTSIPMISTVTGQALEAVEADAAYWGRNVRQPVLFAAAVAECLARDHDGFLEVGPHPVLSGALAACLAEHGRTGLVAASLRRKQPERMALRSALGALYAHGFPIDWRKQHPAGGRCIPLPVYPWQRARYWVESKRFRTTPTHEAAGNEWVHELTWKPKQLGPSSAERSALGELDRRSIVDALNGLVGAQRESAERDGLATLAPRLEHVSVLYILRALRQLGWGIRPGDHQVIEGLAGRLGVAECHHRLFERLCEILVEEGLLGRSGPKWEVRKTAELGDPKVVMATLMEAHPACMTELRLLERCGSNLAEVLRGKYDALSLLFPGGSLTSLEAFYQESPILRAGNRLVRQAVRLMMARCDRGRTLRILEVGAGTGATTSHVLPELPDARLEYVFTDVSSSFTGWALKKFERWPCVRTQILDIENDPLDQGFSPAHFDLVIAANVLHATRNLRDSLSHIRSLLKPSGLLLLLEVTEKHRWIDLTFGLTEGWWRFSDTERRPAYPLLTPSAWLSLLGEVGFAGAEAVPCEVNDIAAASRQAVFLAFKTDAPPLARGGSAKSSWLILADDQGVGDRLAALLDHQGVASCLVRPGQAWGEAANGGISVDPTSAEDFRRVFQDCHRDGPLGVEKIVSLWSLNAAPVADLTSGTLDDAARLGCRSLVALVQALAGEDMHQKPRLWCVTRGAQSVSGERRGVEVAQAPVWGLARVIALEHSGLWGGLVDLDPNAVEPASAARALLDEIRTSDGEDQVALRGDTRYVLRLVCAHETPDRATPPKLRSDATYLVTGGLGVLGTKVARWLVERGAGRLVLTSRRGVPDRSARDASPPGSDVARRIAEIRALEALGVRVTVVAADVADFVQMSALMSDIQRSGYPLRGVIHAAGVASEMPLVSLDAAEFDAVLRPKVRGGWVLHEVTRNLQLDFFVCFSSAAAVWGSRGLAHYAAANHFLDALAHHRRGLGLPGLSINWGWWESRGIITAEMERFFAQSGLRVMSPQRALDVLGGLLESTAAQHTVANVDWGAFKTLYGARGHRFLLDDLAPAATSVKAVAADRTGDLRRRLEAASPGTRREVAVTSIRAEVAKILGMPDPTAIEPRQGFFKMGMDSILTVQLRNQLEAALGRSLPSTVAFEYPTVEALSEFVLQLVAPSEGSATSHAAPRPETAGDALREDLSEEELAALLAERLRRKP